jgi:molecular chaperone DnaK
MSARTTIDFGIHLGITHAEIAVLRGMIADLIKNNEDNDRTPCAVFIDRHGRILVGQRAINQLEDQNAADDVYVEFMRRIGTDHRYEFKASGRAMRPEELTAEVLKSLRADVQQRLGEDIHAAVLTVPSAFEMRQCDATKKAGELAGFSQCPLIMAPTAAALAYGLQEESSRQNWLVYHFGQGTFDVALLTVEDGSILVLNCGGDNYLGGADIDWAVIERLVIPELTANFNLPGFSRSNKKWRTALAVVKRAVEEAKIQLSRSDTAYLERCSFKDADGEMIEVDVKLTRDALVSVAEPIIMRSVDVCERVLKEKNLGPGEIEKMILVGGPTLAPYFREILRDQMGIQLDHSVDPLTVVARGAAVFAGTIPLNEVHAPEVVKPPQYRFSLKYPVVGPDLDPTIRGVVIGPDGASLERFSIEIVLEKTRWRSGRIPLKADGRFKARVQAEPRARSDFLIELTDGVGRKQAALPASFPYTHLVDPLPPPCLIHSIGIVTDNNTVDTFLQKGTPLPARAVRTCYILQAFRKGETRDLLDLPIVEGEQRRADRSMILGWLKVKGSNIRRDVPAGSAIEVTMEIDASRIMRVRAYVPQLDEEFDAVVNFNVEDSGPVNPGRRMR